MKKFKVKIAILKLLKVNYRKIVILIYFSLNLNYLAPRNILSHQSLKFQLDVTIN